MNSKRMIVLSIVGALALAGLLLAASGARARGDAPSLTVPLAQAGVVSDTISYQGRLLDLDGNPINGTHMMTFRLYAQAGGGVPLWSDSFPVPVEEGLFHVTLDVEPVLFDGQALWLGVQVEGDAEEMSPRQPLLPAPYALSLRPGAAVSGTVHGVPMLDIASGESIGLRARTFSADPGDAAVMGTNLGSGAGGVFASTNDVNGVGVRGLGGDTGVYGSGEWMAGVKGESEWGIGVFGTSSEDYGVGGYSTNSDGIYGYSSGIGNGVGGEAITGTGVSGQSRYGAGGEFGSDYGHALVTEGPSLVQGPNPQQVALLKWYPAIQTPMSFTVGMWPSDVAFDGANIWVTNSHDNNVSVLRASDGAHVMTVSVGTDPRGLAFDGANMWVANLGDGTVSVLRASDGAHVMTPTVGPLPVYLAFDGTNMWVTNADDDTVSVLRASDGAHVMTPTVGSFPVGIAFDGTNMWVTNANDGTVSVLRASDGAHVMTPTVGFWPVHVAFDGAEMWVANNTGGNVSVLRASDGAHVMTVTVGSYPRSIAFDGVNMWVADGSDSVSMLRASDGSLVTTVTVGCNPKGIAFDGANMWVTNYHAGTVSKR